MRRLIFPLVLITAGLLLRKPAAVVEPVYRHLLEALPYAALGLAAALCVYFNRARPFTAAGALLLMYYLIQSELQTSLAGPRPLFIYTALSVLFPITVWLLMLLPERGLRNRYGVMTAAIVPLQVPAVMVLYSSFTVDELTAAITAWFPLHPPADYVLSTNASIVFAVAALTGLYILFKKDSEYHAAASALLACGFITLAAFDLPMISTVMYSAAGICLIASLLRSSYDMAYRDELTGIPGRRALNERLKALGRHYAIAMVDVDHFKKFNDTYGHDAGDDVLKMVAQRIAAVQGGGSAYRYGGEEFSIVFPGKDIEDCRLYLEEVRGAVESYQMFLRNRKQRPASGKAAQERRGRRRRHREGKPVSVTISIGAAGPDHRRNTVEDVLKAADAALYRAKQKGRNCVAV